MRLWSNAATERMIYLGAATAMPSSLTFIGAEDHYGAAAAPSRHSFTVSSYSGLELRTPNFLLTRYLPLAMMMRSGQINHVAMAHATLGDDALGELLHVGSLALEHRDLHAAFVVEVHVQRRLR